MTLHVTRDAPDRVTIHVHSGSVHVEAQEHRGHALVFWHELGKHVIEDVEDRARAGFARYCANMTVGSGQEYGTWETLDEGVRRSWIAAFTE